jgi:hypothetical protein
VAIFGLFIVHLLATVRLQNNNSTAISPVQVASKKTQVLFGYINKIHYLCNR